MLPCERCDVPLPIRQQVAVRSVKDALGLAPRSPSVGGPDGRAKGGEVTGTEHDTVARGHIDEVEIYARPRDLAGQVGEDPWAVLDVDYDDLALACDSEVRNRERMLRCLGVRDQDVELGSLARADARGGGRGDAGGAE